MSENDKVAIQLIILFWLFYAVFYFYFDIKDSTIARFSVVASILGLIICKTIYYFLVEKKKEIQTLMECKKYINENKVKIGLFARNYVNKNNVAIANKYCCVKIELIRGLKKFCVLDKTNGKETIFYLGKIIHHRNPEKHENVCYELFTEICSSFNYEVMTEQIITIITKLTKYHNFYKIEKIQNKNHNQLSIDINQASEAELTALPGVTIAKAKHAIKMRNKYAFYISMNQFYEAINLDEEFIEQIQTKGNKILLNELPEYKKLEIKKEL